MKACLILAAVLAATASLQADIIDWGCDDDGDGAIVINDALTDLIPNGGDYTLDLTGAQYWGPGHLNGFFESDTSTDPIVWLVETVENETTFDWTDYHIDIGMNQDFDITGVITPVGWTTVVTDPVPGQSLPAGAGIGYVGAVDYYYGGSGTEVVIGDSGDFGLKVEFVGTVEFCTSQYPTPEPASLTMLALGALAVIRRRR